MLLAAQHGFINIIKFFECPQYPLNYQNTFGDSMLHFAAKGQQAKAVHYLLMRGIKPSIQNKFDETPLFSAAESGNIDVVHRLLKEKECKIDH